jgi:hypothetical protein
MRGRVLVGLRAGLAVLLEYRKYLGLAWGGQLGPRGRQRAESPLSLGRELKAGRPGGSPSRHRVAWYPFPAGRWPRSEQLSARGQPGLAGHDHQPSAQMVRAELPDPCRLDERGNVEDRHARGREEPTSRRSGATSGERMSPVSPAAAAPPINRPRSSSAPTGSRSRVPARPHRIVANALSIERAVDEFRNVAQELRKFCSARSLLVSR